MDLNDLLNGILEDDDSKPVEKPKKISARVAAQALQPEVMEVVTPGITTGKKPSRKKPAPTEDVGDFDEALSQPAPAVKGTAFTDGAEQASKAEEIRVPMPTFVADDLMETMDIRKFASLVVLQTSRWNAKVKDRKASSDAAIANEANANAFETRKNLLVGVDAKLKRIHKSIDDARQTHYDMTLPWSAKGMEEQGRRTGARMLVNTLFFDYTKAMAQAKADMDAAVDDFVPDYPALIELARKQLGKRFDIREYPNASSIRGHFALSFDFQPVPRGDDFKGLPKQQLAALADKINEKAAQQMENAMQDVWARLYKAVTHMHDRLSVPDRSFHDTMVVNMRELTGLLKHLNVVNNLDIEKIRVYLDKFITPHDAQDLRTKAQLRKTTAVHAKNVVDKMNKIAGAKP